MEQELSDSCPKGVCRLARRVAVVRLSVLVSVQGGASLLAERSEAVGGLNSRLARRGGHLVLTHDTALTVDTSVVTGGFTAAGLDGDGEPGSGGRSSG